MRIKKIKIRTKQKKYQIYVGNNLLNNITKIINREKIFFKKYLLILDSKIEIDRIKIIIDKLKNKEKFIFNFVSSEKNKNIKNVNKIIQILLKNNFSRNDCVIAIGGGIIGDISCFAASIYKRGIKFINLPTTLLAQVDACIGGKSGVNDKRYGKNLIGTF